MPTNDTNPIDQIIRSSFPPLDPNGLPLSMTLRGSSAELGNLRTRLLDPLTRRALIQRMTDGEIFDDDEDESEELDQNDRVGGVENRDDQQNMFENVASSGDGAQSSAKRTRDHEENETDDEKDAESDDDIVEDLLLFLPSVECTCSSWNMKDVSGDLVVTSLRILFIATNDDNRTSQSCNDVAIDARCIALHAVDSSCNEQECDVMPHVYCQLSDPAGCEGDDVGYGSALGMVASANVMDENDQQSTNYGEEMQQQTEEESSEDNGVNEVYFKPVICEHIVGKDQQAEACQLLFDVLTRLASLNPAGDSDDAYHGGGGLFNMFSLMAGMGQYSNGDAMDGFEANENDDMVIRFGGSNNFVENDDESEGVPEEERQAMLRRLDGMLVVPPEYEIPTSDDGQFDDAEDDDNDDELL